MNSKLQGAMAAVGFVVLLGGCGGGGSGTAEPAAAGENTAVDERTPGDGGNEIGGVASTDDTGATDDAGSEPDSGDTTDTGSDTAGTGSDTGATDSGGSGGVPDADFAGLVRAVPGDFEAEDFDAGGEGLGYHDSTPGNDGGAYRTDLDVDIVASADSWGRYDIAEFATDEWLAYTIEVEATGSYDLALRVASATSIDNALHVEIDDSAVASAVPVPATGGADAYKWIAGGRLRLTAGQHRLRIRIAEPADWRLNTLHVSEAPAPPASVAPDFVCRFEGSPTDCGFSEHAKVPGRASLVDVARDGAAGVRLHTEPGDTNVKGSGSAERNDLALTQADTGCTQGAEQWWSHSVLFPNDYVVPPDWGVVFDFHQTGSAGQANFQVDAASFGLRLRGYGGLTVDSGRFETLLGPVVRNKWYDFVYHVRWSAGSDGFFDAWVDGEKVLSHRGPTLYNGMGCYLKLANYHTASGQPSSVIHDRVLRADVPEAVSIGPLEGLLGIVDGVLTRILP